MLIFFDTEFTELGIDPRLISIGLISEDGERSFYAELSDTFKDSDVGDFARAEVLPLLEGGSARMTIPELALRLGNWLESFEQPVTLATDSRDWDWPWILAIFGDKWTWPENLASEPAILLFNADPGERFNDARERAFAGGLRRHHSLDDAKANRLGWLAAGGKPALLFLDFDGVLHPESRQAELCCLDRLHDILRACPSAQVVITSTWRDELPLAALRQLIGNGGEFDARILGSTPNLENEGCYGRRDLEIQRWMQDKGYVGEAWLAIDDQLELFGGNGKNVYVVDGRQGLAENDVPSVIGRLSRA